MKAFIRIFLLFRHVKLGILANACDFYPALCVSVYVNSSSWCHFPHFDNSLYGNLSALNNYWMIPMYKTLRKVLTKVATFCAHDFYVFMFSTTFNLLTSRLLGFNFPGIGLCKYHRLAFQGTLMWRVPFMKTYLLLLNVRSTSFH